MLICKAGRAPARTTSRVRPRPAASACRRTQMPRQAYARWVEHRVLVPVQDACGSPDGATCCLHTGHDALPTCRHWPTAARASPPRPPYSDHAAAYTWSSLNLVPKLTPQPPRAGHLIPPSPRACAPSPPPSAIGAVSVNSTSGCLSSQTRAAPNSTRVPSSSLLSVLLRPSR
jgi:hypothetical protein